MPSGNKTPLGLSQWQGADRPKREDFNSDNQTIDTAVRAALEGITGHLEGDAHPTPAQRQRWESAAAHTGEGVASEAGLHGLRYYENRLEVNIGGLWVPCATGQGGGTGEDYKVYGVCVDQSESDPDTSVTYTDDAVGMEPCGAAWQDTFLGSFRPCILRGGKVARYLDPTDYTRGQDGTPADVTSGAEGDVMVEIPKLAYAIHTQGDKLYVRVTDHPDAKKLDERFCYLAHTRAAEGDREKLYVSAYLGSRQGDRLRSLSGGTPAVNLSQLELRALAKAGGDGYDLLGYYPYLLLQCLCLIYGGSRHTQRAMGAGRTQTTQGPLPTGGADKKGLFFGEATGLLQMKAFGVEDLWGNNLYFLEGLRTNEAGVFETATRHFSSEESWQSTGVSGEMSTIATYIGRVCGDNHTGFLLRQGGGTTVTGWCDGAQLQPGCVAAAGGDYYTRNQAGAFYTVVSCGQTHKSVAHSGRLMYL